VQLLKEVRKSRIYIFSLYTRHLHKPHEIMQSRNRELVHQFALFISETCERVMIKVVRSEVLTAVKMKIRAAVFRDMTPSDLVQVYLCF
jgi:arginyl-tRNA--protein-N-Asp/Glu arginylyltransferase